MVHRFHGGVRPAAHQEATRGVAAVTPDWAAPTSPLPYPAGRVPAEVAPAQAEPEAIRAAALWAGLPPLPQEADVLIINGTEAEPYATADRRLMLERPEAVLTGTRLLARMLGATRTVIAVGGDKYECASALRALLPLRGGDVAVQVLRRRYPLGETAVLLEAILGRRNRAAAAVVGVDVAAAVSDGVYDGKRADCRMVTVTGGAIQHPQNLWVPLGTPISKLIDAAGGFSEHPERVLLGGGMTGLAQSDLTAPITWQTSCVVAMTRREARSANRPETVCLRCGRCIAACPQRLEPLYLRQAICGGRTEKLVRLRLMDCTECGACAFICPAHIPLTAELSKGKALLSPPQEDGDDHA